MNVAETRRDSEGNTRRKVLKGDSGTEVLLIPISFRNRSRDIVVQIMTTLCFIPW